LIPIRQPVKEIGTAILIAPSPSGGLWVSSAERLMRLDNNDQATSICESPLWLGKRAGIQCLCEDSAGRLWIGTRRDGLYLYEEGELKKVGLESRAIQSIMEDREGNVWVATTGEGLCRLRPQSFTILNRKIGLLEDTSTSICGDSSGALWCANRSGGPETHSADEVLAQLRAKGHKVIEPLGQTSANSIAVTPNGLLGAPDPRTRGAAAVGQ